jgi:hypothetical protein
VEREAWIFCTKLIGTISNIKLPVRRTSTYFLSIPVIYRSPVWLHWQFTVLYLPGNVAVLRQTLRSEHGPRKTQTTTYMNDTWMIHEWYMNVWKQASFKLASISANRASSLGNGLDLRLHKITKPHRSYLSHTSSSISPESSGKSQSLQVQWIPPGANWRKQNYSKVLVLSEQCSKEWSKAQVHYHSYTYHVCGVMCACSRCVLHHKSLYLICTVDWLRQAQ